MGNCILEEATNTAPPATQLDKCGGGSSGFIRGDQRASPQTVGPEVDPDTISGGSWVTITRPSPWLVYRLCLRETALSGSTPVPPQTPSPSPGPVTLPVQTYILFCWDSQPHLTEETSMGGGCLTQAWAPCHPAAGGLWARRPPRAAHSASGRPLKTLPAGVLPGEQSGLAQSCLPCVCGQAG